MKKFSKVQRNHNSAEDCGCGVIPYTTGYGGVNGVNGVNNGGMRMVDGVMQPSTVTQIPNMTNPYGSMGCGDVRKMQFGNVIPRGLTLQPSNVSEWLAINGYPSARSFTVTVTSTAGVGAVPTIVHLLNETATDLNNAVTNNGSGAGSIVTTYPDGFGGRAISALLGNERFGMGAICIGVAITLTTAGAVTPINSLNARFVTHGYFSNSDLTLSVDTSPTQFCCPPGSLQFIPLKWNIIRTTQLDFLMPGDAADSSTASVTFYFPQN